jgi:hypothetical protein
MSKGNKGKAEGTKEKVGVSGTPSTDKGLGAFVEAGKAAGACAGACLQMLKDVSLNRSMMNYQISQLEKVKAELAALSRKIEKEQSGHQSNPQAWCKAHNTFEPGVPYDKETASNKAPDTKTSLPLAGLLINILRGSK